MILGRDIITVLLLCHGMTQIYATSDADAILAPLKSWSLSDTALPSISRDIDAFYDESFAADSIFMTGGTGCPSCIWRYNISNNSISLEASISVTGYSSAGYESSAMIDDTLYWLGGSAILIKYNLTSGENSLVTTFEDVYFGCMTKHPSKKELYIQGGSGSTYCDNSTQFWIYDIDTNVTSQGPHLLNGRWGPTCIINDYSGSSSQKDPHLYVFAGCSTFIERINLNKVFEDGNDWHQLTTLFNHETVGLTGSKFNFSTDFAYFGVFSYNEYIILMNGWDDYRHHENEMFLFDVSKLTIEYFGQFALLAWSTAPILAKNKVFVFGGATQYFGHTDTIYISDEMIEPTLNPSEMPSVAPTSMPSITPSGIPTTIPTIIPSAQPSATPSSSPTPQPSEMPTTEPSEEPSGVPSLTPSVQPTLSLDLASTVSNTTTATSTVGSTSSDISTSDNEGNGGNEESNNSGSIIGEDSTTNIAIITIGIVVVFCCIVFACLFVFSMRYYVNAQKKLQNININTSGQIELEMQQKMPLKTGQVDTSSNGDNIMISSNGNYNYNENEENKRGGGSGNANAQKSLLNAVNNPLQLPPQPQSVHSFSYMTNSNVADGEGLVKGEKHEENNGDADEELYFENVDGINDNNHNNNNNGVSPGGDKIEVNYNDLIDKLENDNNEDNVVDTAGE